MDTYAHAKALYTNGNYEEAISDLRRTLFFDETNHSQACLMLGDCYRNTHNLEKSLYYYELAYDYLVSDSARLDAKFRIISLYLVFDQPNYALTQIFSLPDSLGQMNMQRKNFYSSLVFYKLKDYAASEEYFLKALHYSNQSLDQSVDSLYATAAKNNDFNVYLPMVLSIIPGMGQLYLGEYESAINSFLLTGAFAGLYVITLVNLSLLDAVLTVAPWFLRYYQGGLLQAKELAVKRKESRDIEYYNALIDIYAKCGKGH
jgi:tetratricopeptide (TPR) repeat protein